MRNLTPSKRMSPSWVPSHRYPSRVWKIASTEFCGRPESLSQRSLPYCESAVEGFRPNAREAASPRRGREKRRAKDPARSRVLLLPAGGTRLPHRGRPGAGSGRKPLRSGRMLRKPGRRSCLRLPCGGGAWPSRMSAAKRAGGAVATNRVSASRPRSAIPLLHCDDADVQESLELPRVQLQRALPGLQRFAVPAELFERGAAPVPGPRKPLVQRERLVEGGERFPRAIGVHARQPDVLPGDRVLRIEPQGLLEGLDGFLRLSPAPARAIPIAFQTSGLADPRRGSSTASARRAARTGRREVPAGSRDARPDNRAGGPPRGRRWRGRLARSGPRDTRGTRRGPASWAGASSPTGPGRSPRRASLADRGPRSPASAGPGRSTSSGRRPDRTPAGSAPCPTGIRARPDAGPFPPIRPPEPRAARRAAPSRASGPPRPVLEPVRLLLRVLSEVVELRDRKVDELLVPANQAAQRRPPAGEGGRERLEIAGRGRVGRPEKGTPGQPGRRGHARGFEHGRQDVHVAAKRGIAPGHHECRGPRGSGECAASPRRRRDRA